MTVMVWCCDAEANGFRNGTMVAWLRYNDMKRSVNIFIFHNIEYIGTTPAKHDIHYRYRCMISL